LPIAEDRGEPEEREMSDSRVILIGPFPQWEKIAEAAEQAGWTVLRVESGSEAFRALSQNGITAVVMPVELRDGPAENLLVTARGTGTRADFVVLGSGRENRAALLAEGADEVLEPPVDLERILAKLARLRDRRRLIDDLGLVVRDPAMLEIFERILRIAPLKVTTLITGESGTGKEVLAQAIHRASDRRDAPFVPVNIGALPESLLESELFGHERGAFTSADARRIGRFEMANGGTLFLDEIGEMSMPSQVNLLRVLEEEQFLRVGGSRKISVDVRVIAATNRELEQLVRDGHFRRDLYYRLKVVELRIPPLRERRGEIAVLARKLADKAAKRHGLVFPGFASDALQALASYEWPGNVRELKNLVDGIVALRPETPIRAADLPAHILHGSPPERPLPALPRDREGAEREFIVQSLLALRAEMAALRELILARGFPGADPATIRDARSADGYPSGTAVFPTRPVRFEKAEEGQSLKLEEMERQAVERALRESGGNRRKAARALGMSERTLYRRIRKFGLAGPEETDETTASD
jgi:DNA-binding NtrC family response regulator